ncbi:unnamed protein product [Mucor hiemalis]
MKSSLGLALLLCSSSVLAIQKYCEQGFKPIADKDLQLDLGQLNKEFIVYQNTTRPPSVESIVNQINICDPLPIPDEPNNGDICKKGSLICRRTIIVKKDKDNKDVETVFTVQPIAVDADNKLNAEFKPINTEADPTKNGYQYILTLNGGEYNNQAQSASITLECDETQKRSDRAKDPVVVSYNNNVLNLQWKTVFACATKVGEKVPDNKDGDKKPEEGEKPKGMSGIGIFFTLVIVLAGIYFVGGAFYNFKMYNARGLDLIPHRDFWLDLPYLIRDLFAHIVDSVMSRRRGSGGYVAV